ncbi:MAG: DUF2807 domain-containing protein [Defluviitaleaceae bacterium]|nr:DUF2807 domain-containing protein [Defluviitaleaceae bacterium]
MLKKFFILLLVLIGMAFLFSGCITIGGNPVRGTGQVVSRSMEVGDFNSIDVSGNFVVVYRQSEDRALTIAMQENLFDHLDVDTRGGTLIVGSRRGFDTTTANRPRMYVYAPYLSAAEFSGAVNASDWDNITVTRFSLDISGAVNINVGLDVEYLEIDASGAANITMWGSATNIDIDGSGALSITAGDLEIEGGRVDISGAANVTLSTLENVDVRTSGVARVRAS